MAHLTEHGYAVVTPTGKLMMSTVSSKMSDSKNTAGRILLIDWKRLNKQGYHCVKVSVTAETG